MGLRLRTMQRAGDNPVVRALLALESDRCQCKKVKKVGWAFCYDCFSALPAATQRGLYKRVGEGFEAEYEVAAAWLLHD